MRSSKRRVGFFGVFAALAALFVAGSVVAQTGLQIGGSRANFGVHRLRTGFLPDPKVIRVVSGGDIDASTLGLGEGCGGWVTRVPDAIVKLSGTSSMLRFFVRAQGNGDTTLLVNDAAGHWYCNDDVQSGNLNPMVSIPNAQPGQYDVWIGSYERGQQLRGTLNITEMASQHP